MDEQDIAKALAEKVAEPVLEPQAIPPEPEKPEDTDFHNNLPLENTLEKMNLMDYFQIPQVARHTAEISQWISEVIDWAREESHSSEYADILRVINDQERVMGNKLKPDRLMNLRQFVKINQQRRRLAEQERALYA